MKETTKKTTEAVKTTSKKELFDFLKTNAVKAEGNQNLSERIAYAVKSFETDQKKVTKEDLSELAKELSSYIIESAKKSEESTPETEAPKEKKSEKKPKEAALKPKKKVEKKPEPEEEDEEEEKPVKKTSKKGTAKTPAKKNGVESMPPVSTKGTDAGTAILFPPVLDLEGLDTKLVSCAGEYESFDQIRKALEAEKSLYIACYWSKTQVKKFEYAQAYQVKPETCKNGFPNDLDILNAVLTCETMDRLFAMSLYTEALFRFDGDDFKAVEDTDPRSGKKFKVRVSSGMEFEIYRPEDEEIFSE